MITPPLKQWHGSGEWHGYAACADGDPRFVTPPERMSEDDVQEVMARCFACKVRPECARHVVENTESGVWSCSEFIPEVSLDDSDEQSATILLKAASVRAFLESQIPDELERRGDF